MSSRPRAFGVTYKLVEACNEKGIDIIGLEAHRADSDVEMTDRLYRHLVAGA